jgi:hypothetical protein
MGAHLIDMHLVGVYLIGVDLIGTHLMSASHRQHLVGMYLIGVYGPASQGHASYRRQWVSLVQRLVRKFWNLSLEEMYW